MKSKTPKKKKFQPSLLDIQEQRERTFSVGEFLVRINSFLTSEEYEVVGEINQVKPYPNATYFSLNDKKDGSVMNCALFSWKYKNIQVPITEGMEVKVKGHPEIYKPRGTFSFVVSSVEPVGEGALRKAYELLKKKLEEEGLFARKRPLPEFIQHIGVISSKNGVVIQDFRKNLNNRGFRVSFYDARVEGIDAPRTIIAGIKAMNKLKPDIVVIMRGGGSLESMQAFNNEKVARAVFASDIPVLCGIGHDVDVPIASLVADLAVSTPTATAHTVNQSWRKLEEALPLISHRLINRFEITIQDRTRLTEDFFFRIETFIETLQTRIIRAGEDMASCFSSALESFRQKLKHGEQILTAFNPENQLKLGYSIVFDHTGKVLKSIDTVKIGDMIKVRMQKGSLKSQVKEKE